MSRRRGFAVLTSTAFSLPLATAKSVLPFVFTMSGSSTPSSWTFVPEKSTPCLGAAGAPSRAAAVASSVTGPPNPYGPTKRVACDLAYWSRSGHRARTQTRRPALVEASARELSAADRSAVPPSAAAATRIASAASRATRFPKSITWFIRHKRRNRHSGYQVLGRGLGARRPSSSRSARGTPSGSHRRTRRPGGSDRGATPRARSRTGRTTGSRPHSRERRAARA